MKKILDIEIELEERRFDFTSSGQSIYVDNQIKWNDDVLINMSKGIDEIDEKEQVFQVLVCEECGYTNCEPGNWVAIRKIGDKILMIPAFELIIEEEEKLKNEYYPPKYLLKNGVFEIDNAAFNKLKLNVPAFEKISNIKSITGQELYHTFLFESPFEKVKIGEEYKFESENFIATTIGELTEVTNKVEIELLKLKHSKEFELSPIKTCDEELSLFVDDYKISEWKIGILNDGQIFLRIGNYKIKTGTNKR